MNQDQKIVAVAGATGRQGGSVAKSLLTAGWPVRALTRNTHSPAALALQEAGAQLVQAEFDDLDSIRSAFEGAYGAYSVQLPFPVEIEERDGKALADMALESGIQHFIYGSVGGAERDAGIPHFESKWQVEQHIRKIGLPHSIIRPSYFMENFEFKKAAILEGKLYAIGLSPKTLLQMTSAKDIGAFARIALEQPENFLGRAIEIAGDEMNESEMAEHFSQHLGRKVVLVEDPEPAKFADMSVMNAWFDKEGYQADILEIRRIYPQMQNFSEWLREQKWQ